MLHVFLTSFLVCAGICAAYIYMAFGKAPRRDLRCVFPSCFLVAVFLYISFYVPLMFPTCFPLFSSHSLDKSAPVISTVSWWTFSFIFPLCSPHIFYIFSGQSLDRPAPVIPIPSWLVISFTFPLCLPPLYFQYIYKTGPAPGLRQSLFLRWYLPLIFLMFPLTFLYLSLCLLYSS